MRRGRALAAPLPLLLLLLCLGGGDATPQEVFLKQRSRGGPDGAAQAASSLRTERLPLSVMQWKRYRKRVMGLTVPGAASAAGHASMASLLQHEFTLSRSQAERGLAYAGSMRRLRLLLRRLQLAAPPASDAQGPGQQQQQQPQQQQHVLNVTVAAIAGPVTCVSAGAPGRCARRFSQRPKARARAPGVYASGPARAAGDAGVTSWQQLVVKALQAAFPHVAFRVRRPLSCSPPRARTPLALVPAGPHVCAVPHSVFLYRRPPPPPNPPLAFSPRGAAGRVRQ